MQLQRARTYFHENIRLKWPIARVYVYILIHHYSTFGTNALVEIESYASRLRTYDGNALTKATIQLRNRRGLALVSECV